jgi:hypothetical protein
MTEPDRASLRHRLDVHRTVAWLTDQGDHASFQLDVVWSDGVERLPEVYALEKSHPAFEVAFRLLQTALDPEAGLSVKVYPVRQNAPGTNRTDGKKVAHNVSLRIFPRERHMTQESFDEGERNLA